MRKLQRTSIDGLDITGHELTTTDLAAVTGGKDKRGTSIFNERCEGDPYRCQDPSKVQDYQAPRW